MRNSRNLPAACLLQHALRFGKRLCIALLASSLLGGAIQAQPFQQDVYLDLDNNPSTGCQTVTPAGTVDGAEVRLHATLDDPMSSVTSVGRAACSAGVFGALQPQSANYAVGSDNGIGGGDVVELATPLGGLGQGGAARFTYVSSGADGADLAAAVFPLPSGSAGSSNGPVVIPAAGLASLMLLAGSMLWLARRHPGFGTSMALLLLLGAGVVWAANFIADGQVADWSGVPALASDPAGDQTGSEPEIDIRAVFAAVEANQLFLRIDVAGIAAAVNTAPVADDAGFTLAENAANGTLVGKVVATDADAGQTLSYAISSGNAGGAFAIDAAGNITVANSAALDFETAPVMTLAVDVSDDGNPALTDGAAVTITLTDANDAPIAADAVFSIAENSANGSAVGTAGASDPDAAAPNNALTFAITAGNVGNAFAIDPATGAIGVADTTQLDFESTPVFSLTVTVTDGGALQDTALVTVNLLDANEAPVLADATRNVVSDSPAGTPVGAPVAAADPDGSAPNNTLSYAITLGNTGNAFQIGADGQLSVQTQAAVTPANAPFMLTVTVTDGGGLSDTATVTVTVNDVNDAPSFVVGPDQTVVEDAGMQTVDPWATAIDDGDPGVNQNLTFQITGNDNPALFSAGPAVSPTGVLTYTPAANAFGTANLAVRLMDDGGTASGGVDTSPAQNFAITVTAVNDAPTAAAAPSADVHTNIAIDQPDDAVGDLLGSARGFADPDSAAPFVLAAGSIGTFATMAGGSITVTADGHYHYSPPLHHVGADGFVYQVCDGEAVPACADVTLALNVAGRDIVFVDDGAAAAGDGTLERPLQTLPDALAALGGATDVFLFSGNYAGGVTLANGVRVFGQGSLQADFEALYGIAAMPALSIARPALGQSRPIIANAAGNGITLGQNNALRGLEFGACATAALAGNNFATLAVDDNVAIGNTAGRALTLTNGTVTATFSGVVSQNSATQGVALSQVAGSLAMGGTTVGAATTDGIQVNASTANVDFGNTSVSGGSNGVRLLNNGAGVRTFGTLSLTGGSGGGFVHDNGGTVVAGVTTISGTASQAIDIRNHLAPASIGFGATQVLKNTATVAIFLGGVGTENSGAITFEQLSGSNTMNPFLVGVGNNGLLSVTSAGGGISANGAAINLTSAATSPVALNLGPVSSSGGTQGINLVNVTGVLSASGGTLSEATVADVVIAGGSVDFTYDGNISDDQGTLVSISGQTGGTKDFNGPITDLGDGDGSGITLANNTGATIRFDGGLTLATGANPAFSATGGGTLAVTDPAAVDNTIVTTTGTALNVVNTIIHADDLTFASISASGGANGIVLDGTCGAVACSVAAGVGGLVVTGDGSDTSLGGNGSGGTLSNMQGADGSNAGTAIRLRNTRDVVLRRVNVTGANQNYGIRGYGVHNFVLEYSTVGAPNPANAASVAANPQGTAVTLGAPENAGEGAIYFGNAMAGQLGLTGAASITDCEISAGRADNLRLTNSGGSLDRLVITGTTFGLNSAAMAAANNALAVEANRPLAGTTVLNSTVTGNAFTGSPGNAALFAGQEPTAALGVAMDTVFANNTVSNNHANNNIGASNLTIAGFGNTTFDVSGNSLRDAHGSAITLQLGAPIAGSAAATSFIGRVENNTIGVSGAANSGSVGGNGIFLSFADNTTAPKGVATVALTDNQIRRYGGNAAVFADNTGGAYNVNATLQGNLGDEAGAGAFAGLALTAGAPASSDDIDVCAQIGGAGALRNDFHAGDPANSNDIILGVSTGNSSMRLPNYAGATLADVQNFVFGNNNFAGTAVAAFVDAPATPANFTGGAAACPTPP